MIQRGLGCLPDAPDAKGSHAFDDVCGVAVDYPDSVDLSHLCTPPSDQGNSNTCYAHAWANAITQAARRTNPTFERPSQLLIADMTRGMIGQRDVDIGAPLSVVEIALRICGFAPESAVPWDESRIFDHIYADEYQAAIMQVGLRSHRVLTNPRASIQAALSAGRGCVVGMDVDRSFCDWSTDETWGFMQDDVLGGHAMSVCGHDRDSIQVINSWGEDWGGLGFGWISWDYIESTHCHSVWIVDAAPEYWHG